MLTTNELNRPLKADATIDEIFERFLKATHTDRDMVKFYKLAKKPFLSDLGLRNDYISNAIIIWLKNGEKIIYKFNQVKGDNK